MSCPPLERRKRREVLRRDRRSVGVRRRENAERKNDSLETLLYMPHNLRSEGRTGKCNSKNIPSLSPLLHFVYRRYSQREGFNKANKAGRCAGWIVKCLRDRPTKRQRDGWTQGRTDWRTYPDMIINICWRRIMFNLATWWSLKRRNGMTDGWTNSPVDTNAMTHQKMWIEYSHLSEWKWCFECSLHKKTK